MWIIIIKIKKGTVLFAGRYSAGLSETSLEGSLPCGQHPAKPHYPKQYEAGLHIHYVFPKDSS